MPQTYMPMRPGTIGEILAIVQKLVDTGHAYAAANGDVYYRVTRFAGYGKLSGKNPDELLSGALVAARGGGNGGAAFPRF